MLRVLRVPAVVEHFLPVMPPPVIVAEVVISGIPSWLSSSFEVFRCPMRCGSSGSKSSLSLTSECLTEFAFPNQ